MADHDHNPAEAEPYAAVRNDVLQRIVIPDYKREVEDVTVWRHRWRKIANWVEGLAQVLLGVATMLAFAAGFFNVQYLPFAAGCFNTLCLVMLRFSAYANRESAERNAILGRLLVFLGATPPPTTADIVENPTAVEKIGDVAVATRVEVANARQGANAYQGAFVQQQGPYAG